MDFSHTVQQETSALVWNVAIQDTCKGGETTVGMLQCEEMTISSYCRNNTQTQSVEELNFSSRTTSLLCKFFLIETFDTFSVRIYSTVMFYLLYLAYWDRLPVYLLTRVIHSHFQPILHSSMQDWLLFKLSLTNIISGWFIFTFIFICTLNLSICNIIVRNYCLKTD